MDYNGSVETAANTVTFELYDPNLIAKERDQVSRFPLSKYQRKFWKSQKDFIDYLLSCHNLEFNFDKLSVDIPSDGVIHLTVAKKN